MSARMEKVELVKRAVAVMVQRQDTLNKKIDANWQASKFPFYRAAWTELGEAMQYLSWEWWKKSGDGDLRDFKSKDAFDHYCLEIVDTLHFVISMHLNEVVGDGKYTSEPEANVRAKLVDKAGRILGDYLCDPSTAHYASLFQQEKPRQDLATLTDEAALTCLYKIPRNACSYLVSIGCSLGMGFAGLFAFYLGKNILNVFRQEYGYKDGSYIKLWDSDGNEDNLHLARAINAWLYPLSEAEAMDRCLNGNFEEELRQKLTQLYGDVLVLNGRLRATPA